MYGELCGKRAWEKEKCGVNRTERKEIKRALCGRVQPAEDGRLQVLPASDHRILGVGDGAVAVRLFGVMRSSRCYETRSGRSTVTQLARKSMQNIGRGLALSEQPDTIACLIRYLLTPPVVLTFRYERDVPTLTAWAGRSPMGWLSLRRAVQVFEKQLPEELRQSGKKPPKEEKEKKPKKQKKQEKQEKKAEENNTAEKEKASADKKKRGKKK